jgi:hypothetical protein
MAKAFDKIRTGLEADARERHAGSAAEKARWARVYGTVAPEHQQMAAVLLNVKPEMDDAAIFRAVEIAGKSLSNHPGRPGAAAPTRSAAVEPSRQDLFALGHSSAQEILGHAPTHPLKAFADAPAGAGFVIDARLYEAGAASAEQLKAFMENRPLKRYADQLRERSA